MQTVVPLEPGQYYHIYNRGVNRENIFLEERNYAYFLQLYGKHIAPVADTFAYCLLKNHFHLLVKIKQTDAVSETASVLTPARVSKAFNNWFVAYAKSINKTYTRIGPLFQHHFGRQRVTSDRYFITLIHYIHYNPQKHGFVTDFREWPHSSYHSLLAEAPTRLERATVLEWFGGQEKFRELQQLNTNTSTIRGIIGEDDF